MHAIVRMTRDGDRRDRPGRIVRRRESAPAGPAPALRLSRRSILALAGLLPVFAVGGARRAAAAPDPKALVMRGGWVLRAGDLSRLGLR